MRIGYGVDFHQMVDGRAFWLGGIQIPYDKGALGHSDADVLLHAISDALLGSLALGDIGEHFSDKDISNKNIDSKIILKYCYELVFKQGYTLSNIDTTICLEKPKILAFVPSMRKAISHTLSISIDKISIKATTTEKMGFVGREEGIIAYASVLVLPNNLVAS